MIHTEIRQATCDWPRCLRAVSLNSETYKEQIKELRQHGWRASENLDKFCLCKHHNESRKWEK